MSPPTADAPRPPPPPIAPPAPSIVAGGVLGSGSIDSGGDRRFRALPE